MAHDLKATLQLPKTDFPMRANLPQREPERVAHWARLGLYERIQRRREAAGAPTFVLHDGPPFTNGDVHIGTALNKTLKDITLRYKTMRGFRTPYVPGWDCHGLPIEQKVARDLQSESESASAGGPAPGSNPGSTAASTAELRERCAAFSESWIARQTEQFQRLGVLADWGHGYKTKDRAFEADVLRTFATFVEQGLVYRSKKPVYWSIPFETALAEAEIEYKDHVSPSIWVRFPVAAADAARFGLPSDPPPGVVIWTTTPWTLPANLAIAVNPEIEYVVADVAGPRAGRYLVARPLLARFAQDLGAETPPVERAVVPGRQLEHLPARHPFIDRPSPIVLADYVTTESGTGAVHTAPGHGMDDYQTGLKYGLEIYCPVGPDGRYVDDGRVPAALVGLSALESVEDLEKKRTSTANVGVLKLLDAAGSLLAKRRYPHSYPHCWRSKTPIIFRAVDQWFVALDRGGARATALAEIARIGAHQGWIPAWGEARIRGAVESRPDWCISRQRAWGIPIPAFYGADRRGYLDAGVVRAIADQVERAGSNLWYERTPEQLLADVARPADWPAPADLTCGRDTLDVWIDSGSSHAAVLRRGVGGTSWPADLYLEGSDQHRGWFQSSLWTSVIAYGSAPYRAVLTHGFIVDEERRKISKSSTYAKPQTSEAYIAEYGADVIRLWIASQDFRDDIPISREILSHVGETYRLIRNTLRYQLANLFDFAPDRDGVAVEAMDTLDRWALHQTAELVRACTAAYAAYEFHRVYQLCNQFCAVTLSATYHDILKDRLYTLASGHPLRRSSQTALHHVFGALLRVLAPILVFTTDEAWCHATAQADLADDSIHLQDWPDVPADWTDAGIEGEVGALLQVRSQVNAAIEPLRAAGNLGKSLDAAVAIAGAPDDPVYRVLERHRDFLPELFIASRVSLGGPAESPALTVTVRPCAELGDQRCPRCWRWVPAEELSGDGAVCHRCAEALHPI